MSDWKKLPKFGEPTMRSRMCNHSMSGERATDETACGRDAIVHVIWTLASSGATKGSFLCERHVGPVLDLFQCHSFHPMGSACGLPGSLFHPPENICRTEAEDLRAIIEDVLESVEVA